MSSNGLQAVYLIAGSDRPKVDLAVRRLRARFPSEAVEMCHARERPGDAVVADCNAMGLFADAGRLILVEGVEAWKAPDVKAIAAYLHTPAPDTTLALVGGELTKDSPMVKAIRAAKGGLLLWDVPKRGLHGWVGEQFRAHAASADPDACRLLVELVGEEMYELAAEVEKLAVWAGGDRVSVTDVERMVAARGETTSFALTDAFGGRDLRGVLEACEGLLAYTADAPARTIPRIVSILTTHLSRLRSAQRLEADGVSAKDAASMLRLHPYFVSKLFQQAGNFSADELDSATVRIAALDVALKGGSHLGAELELERALVAIVPRARRHAGASVP